MINPNFESIIWVAGHFGIVIREQIEELVYHNKYSRVSANRTLAKLEREHGLLKRIDRGKRKTDGYKLTNDGIKYFRRNYGYEPKNYNSGDKLLHSIYILNFYVHLINDMKERGLIENESYIIEEKRKLYFLVQKELKFLENNKETTFIPDAFCLYRYSQNRGKVFYLEIENSDRRTPFVAQKTLHNYEGYFLSGNWKKESWQHKERKVFPYILIVSYSDFKSQELIKQFNKKMKIQQLKNMYYFSDYKTLKENGFSGKVWRNINNEKVSFI